MLCPKCNAQIKEKSKTCPECGAGLSKNTAKEAGKNFSKKTWVIIGAAVVLVIAAALFCILYFGRNANASKENTPSESSVINLEGSSGNIPVTLDKVDTNNNRIQVNLANWGIACTDGNSIYYTDYSTGIYRMKTLNLGESDLIVSGKYSDLAFLKGKIVGIIYDDFGAPQEILMIDPETGDSKSVYTRDEMSSTLISQNVIDDKYYFTVDLDTLLYIDADGKLGKTDFHNTVKVTDSGVYVSDDSGVGLTLMSFDNEEIARYEAVNDLQTGVFFERDGYVYIQCYDGTNNILYRINQKTKELENFPAVQGFYEGNTVSYINFWEDYFFVTTTGYGEDSSAYSRIYRISEDGTEVTGLASQTYEEDLPLATLTIIGRYLFVNYPLIGEIGAVDINNLIAIEG